MSRHVEQARLYVWRLSPRLDHRNKVDGVYRHHAHQRCRAWRHRHLSRTSSCSAILKWPIQAVTEHRISFCCIIKNLVFPTAGPAPKLRITPNNANFPGFKPKIWLKNDWVWGNLVFKGCNLPLDAKLVGTSLESALLGGLGLPSLVN